MNRITHSLVGYDRLTERVAEEFDVPDGALRRAMELARVPADDLDAILCYPLDAGRARDLANILKANIDTENRDYFLEGFAAAEMPYEFTDDEKFHLDSRKDPASRDRYFFQVRDEYSIWIHNDAKKDHIKIAVARSALDDYASQHGQQGHRAVIDLLNARINDRVREMVNRAIEDGRATGGYLELNSHDLGAVLDR